MVRLYAQVLQQWILALPEVFVAQLEHTATGKLKR